MKYWILKYKEDAKPPHSKGRKDKPVSLSATYVPAFMDKKDAELTAKIDFNNEVYVERVEF